MKKLIELANHILIMKDDTYLNGHPEWIEIVNEAMNALKADKRSYNIALLKELKANYDMGFYTDQEYQQKVKALS